MARKTIGLCFALLAAGLAAGCEETPDNTGDDSPFRADRVLNIAHRGGRMLAPEATSVAFQNAVDVGADVLEFDLHATSDGVVVCMHDSEVDRTTDGTGLIREMTFDELRALDAGYNFSPDDGETYPYRGTGLVVPTFAEVLDSFPDQYFMVEIKQFTPHPSIAAGVTDVIGERDMWDQVLIASMNDTVVQEIRADFPEAITGMGFAEGTELVFLDEHHMDTYEPAALYFQAPADSANAELIATANRFGIKIHAWTINDIDEMRAAVELGVHGIITDDPVTLGSLLQL